MQDIKPCPECGSQEQYAYKEELNPVETTGTTLLPDLKKGMFSTAKYLPVVCADCGYMRSFASKDARALLETSKHWFRI